jgi:hypothetical protein
MLLPQAVRSWPISEVAARLSLIGQRANIRWQQCNREMK